MTEKRGRGRPRKQFTAEVLPMSTAEEIEENFDDPAAVDPGAVDDEFGDFGDDLTEEDVVETEVEAAAKVDPQAFAGSSTVAQALAPVAAKAMQRQSEAPSTKGLHNQTIDRVTASLEQEEEERKAKAAVAIEEKRKRDTAAKAAATGARSRTPRGQAVTPATPAKKISPEVLKGFKSQLEQISDALGELEDPKLHEATKHIAQAVVWLDAVKKFS